MNKDKKTLDPLPKSFFKSIFTKENRGVLLDVVVFLLNLLLMRYLTKLFIEMMGLASNGDGIAQFTLFAFCVAIFILPPFGATLKRWHFHQRFRLNRKDSDPEEFMGGCLFNPIMFFCLNIVIFSAINAFIFQFIYEGKEPSGAVFVSAVLFGIILVIFQTILVYRYFSPPKTEPNEFFRSRLSENLGDLCLFLNMILFQVLWSLVAIIPFNRVSGISDFAGRIFFLSFIALLIYFPPRIFYLAEDLKRPRAWLTILLANSPVIFRILIGSN